MVDHSSEVGIVGSGAMGSGIAQVAAMAGHKVILYDTNEAALEKARSSLKATLMKLQEKGKVSSAEDVMGGFLKT